jgi:hypothetical protein|tara:strand:- start:76 stop:807 length:732 start_codon:yes stop_codon:yes gene_type:complete
MSSEIKANTISSVTTNGDLTITGNGTGVPNLEAGTKLNGVAFPASFGDVAGPGSSTDNAIPRFDSTTGKIIQNSGITVDDSNIMTTAGLITANGGISTTTVSASAAITANGGITLGGAISGADQTVSRVNLKDYGEVTNAIGSVGGGTQDVDVALGNNVTATVDTGTTTFTFSNPTASDELCGFTLFLTNGGSQTVNWPATVDFPGGTAPTLTASGVDILVFVTTDGGTIWHGMASSLDSKTP